VWVAAAAAVAGEFVEEPPAMMELHLIDNVVIDSRGASATCVADDQLTRVAYFTPACR